jgi:hypothetical protein
MIHGDLLPAPDPPMIHSDLLPVSGGNSLWITRQGSERP